jgi:hydrogenase large subunit
MSTILAEPKREQAVAGGNVVEMSWDPITRIVGSLGIYTKIDFAQRKSSSAIAPRPSFGAIRSS